MIPTFCAPFRKHIVLGFVVLMRIQLIIFWLDVGDIVTLSRCLRSFLAENLSSWTLQMTGSAGLMPAACHGIERRIPNESCARPARELRSA